MALWTDSRVLEGSQYLDHSLHCKSFNIFLKRTLYEFHSLYCCDAAGENKGIVSADSLYKSFDNKSSTDET